MRILKTTILLALVVALASCGSAYGRVSQYDHGTQISALGLDSNRSTACMNVETYNRLTFEIELVDANDSVTAVTMTCSSARTSACTTTYPIQSVSVASGTATSSDVTWTKTTGAGDVWVWNLETNYKYLQCTFAATGTPAAADTITVQAMSGAL